MPENTMDEETEEFQWVYNYDPARFNQVIANAHSMQKEAIAFSDQLVAALSPMDLALLDCAGETQPVYIDKYKIYKVSRPWSGRSFILEVYPMLHELKYTDKEEHLVQREGWHHVIGITPILYVCILPPRELRNDIIALIEEAR